MSKKERQQEIIKLKAKIRKIKTKQKTKSIQSIYKMKSWFFEKICKIDKLKGRERISNQTEMYKQNITTDTKEIQRIIKTYFKNLYSTKLEIPSFKDKCTKK
jgi:predicted solute-binding protein